MSKRASAHRHAASGLIRKRKRIREVARSRVNVLSLHEQSHAPSRDPVRRAQPSARLKGSTQTPIVPEAIRRRFLIEHDRYYFPDGARAFIDRGDQLTTRRENARLIKSLAMIAQARGWREVTIAGTARFKERMWIASQLAGLAVQGFKPTLRTQAKLARARARAHARPSPEPVTLAHASAPAEVSVPTTPARATPTSGPSEWRGRLIEHGPAPYQFDPANAPSYALKLQTESGERTLWGVDLKRALQASLSQPTLGAEVVVRRVGQEAVTAQSGSRPGQGEPSEARTFQRNRYVIETREFLQTRANLARVVRDPSVSARAATKRYPELSSTYLQLRVARLAAHRLHLEEDRQYFVSFVRRALATSIARGEPLRSLSVRTRARTQQDRPHKMAEPLRE